MKKIIGLCGFKGTGKDFIADLLWYKKISIAEAIKIEAARKKNFLEEDDILIEKADSTKTGINKLKKIASINSLSKKTEDMTDAQVLQKVNLYKNYDELRTRKALYDYFGEEKENGYEHTSLAMIENIKKEKESVAITDTRTLLEAIDILLEGGFLINLFNSRSENLEQITFFHFSEYELWKKIEGSRIGFAIDITSRDSSYLKEQILEIINLFYKNFEGYSEEFIKDIKRLRETVIKIVPSIESSIAESYNKKNLKDYEKGIKNLDHFKKYLQKAIEKEYSKILKF